MNYYPTTGQLNYPAANDHKDLLAFLLSEYTRVIREQADKKGEVVTDDCIHPQLLNFVKFCQDYLASNSPVGTVYLDEGFGIRLQSGQLVPLHKAKQRTEMRDEGIPITLPKKSLDFGVERSLETPSFKII